VQTRKRIEAQGFADISDLQVAQLNYWLRFSPAVCAIWTAIGLYFASPGILAALVPFALLGGFLKRHPFDAFYNHGLRYLTGGPPIPAYGMPRRFACRVASVVLSGAALGFYLGLPAVGYLLGGMLVVAASVNVTTGLCLPSFVYGKLVGGPFPIGDATTGI
jgi:hypothetical protein